VTLSAQEIISQTQQVIQRDTLFFLEETTVRENGTSYPDTLVNTYLIGDSTTTANKLFDVALQPMVQVSEGMKQALRLYLMPFSLYFSRLPARCLFRKPQNGISRG